MLIWAAGKIKQVTIYLFIDCWYKEILWTFFNYIIYTKSFDVILIVGLGTLSAWIVFYSCMKPAFVRKCSYNLILMQMRF